MHILYFVENFHSSFFSSLNCLQLSQTVVQILFLICYRWVSCRLDNLYLNAVNQSWSPTDIFRWYLRRTNCLASIKLESIGWQCEHEIVTVPWDDRLPQGEGKSCRESFLSYVQDGRAPHLCSTPATWILLWYCWVWTSVWEEGW